jgi:peptidylprolyl isomerase
MEAQYTMKISSKFMLVLATVAVGTWTHGYADDSCSTCTDDKAEGECTHSKETLDSSSDPSVISSTTSSDVQKISEAFGHLIGRNLDHPGVTFDPENVIKGIRAAQEGTASPMTESEYEEALGQIHERAFNDLASNNMISANEFMEDNAYKDGVVEVETRRLQYQVLNSGAGTDVAEHSSPTITYVGTYADGTVFGSSEDGGGPVTLHLDQTIDGFNRGIVGMKEGEKRRLYIHPDLGYGTGGHLPPNSLLIFDVEVVTADTVDDSISEEIAELSSSEESEGTL